MPDWNAIIWTIIWLVGGVVVLVLVVWVTFVSIAARAFKQASREFDKGFDSDFFRNRRR